MIGTVAMLTFGYANESRTMDPVAGFAAGMAGSVCAHRAKMAITPMLIDVQVGWVTCQFNPIPQYIK